MNSTSQENVTGERQAWHRKTSPLLELTEHSGWWLWSSSCQLDTPLLPSDTGHFSQGSSAPALLCPEGHFTGRRPPSLQFWSANTPPLLWYTSIVPTNLFWQQELWYATNNKSLKAITKNCQQTTDMFPPRPRRGMFGVDLHASKEHLLPG